MILQALTDYYDRRRRQEDGDRPPPFGYASERVGFVLVLDEQGQVLQPIPLGDTDDKGQRQPRVLEVPRPLGGRTSGIRAYFLCDKTQYVLGAGGDKPARDREAFEASKDKHLRYLADSDDPGAVAVRRFFETWDPTQAETLEYWPEMAGANLVFRLDGQPGYIHESPALQAIWQDRFAEENEAEERQCLVTGEDGPAAMLHPPVKGVRGAQSSGAFLVSFNAEAFCSYGQGVAGKGLNAPVSQRAAFAYTTALNELLRWDSPRKLRLGETSVVFWAVRDASEENDKSKETYKFEKALPAMLSGRRDDSHLDPDTAGRVGRIMEAIREGRKPADVLEELDPSVTFYVLGLAAPSQARLTVRFWMVATLDHLLAGIQQHYEDMKLQTRYANERDMPSLWRLLAERTRDRDLDNESNSYLSRLYEKLLFAVLTQQRYPRALLTGVLGRIRAEIGKASRLDYEPVSHPRVALIKAILRRDACRSNRPIPPEVNSMALNEDTKDVPYRLGRLFAVLEKTQQDAHGIDRIGETDNAMTADGSRQGSKGKLKRTIRDSYFTTASMAPQAVFTRLIQNSKNHISKIRQYREGYAVHIDKKISEIIDPIDIEKNPIPTHMNLEEQGKFVLGYYHQRNVLYPGRDRKEPAPADGPDNTPALEEETA
ncbi:type I-C CRISPR-associated protein Cas8c/Csd1 [Ferruginivarius sediminum]|uniref:Type I-C CRISPR-associated protein Cas8c/Csd1 n=1 Tax=Ferruginivarius sediminum TaxID=2661937 RepID=A0A369TA45_9PROT|nr:type I-C CRISPR-associated protein Cas8c/Csd1 [Ferruginivarius sediminum]RDD61245.1 type I-C CRISPR-associated protein Cas8c/Csd1 [Ferruginivarius sediminum]